MVELCRTPEVVLPNLVSGCSAARILWGYIPRRRTAVGRFGCFGVGTVSGFGSHHTGRARVFRGSPRCGQ